MVVVVDVGQQWGGGGSGDPLSVEGGDGYWGKPDSSCGTGGSRQGRRHHMDQDGLRRQIDLLAQDVHQRTDGHRNIMHTNTATTVYEDDDFPVTARSNP